MERSFWLGLTLVLVLATIFTLYNYSEVASGKYRGDDYYVSDEVWYATSARNLLEDVFHYHPHYGEEGYAYATLVYTSVDFLEEHMSEIEECVRSLGGAIVRANYTTTGDKIPAVWVKVPEDNFEKLKECLNPIKVRSGFEYPSKNNIYNYQNAEHPPLGKYIIMASMVLLGDNPTSWRFPGLIEAFLIIIMVYLAGYRLLNALWGVVASVSLILDPMFRAMSMVAMLDIHLTFFTALALLLIIYDRPMPALVAGWLAFSVKFSGLFVILAIYLYMRIYRRECFLGSLWKSAATSITYILISLPLILDWGLNRWIQEHLNAFSWHTTSRGTGPTPSPPWGWFFNIAPMALHYNPDLIARANLVSYPLAAFFTLLLIPALIERKRAYIPMLFIGSIFLGYTGIFVKGNRTLYSFYAVQLSPAVSLAFAISLFLILLRESEISALIDRGWARILDALLGREEIPLPQELYFLKPFLDMDRHSLAMVLSALAATFSSIILHYYAFLPYKSSAILGKADIALSNALTNFLNIFAKELSLKGLLFGFVIFASAIMALLSQRELTQTLKYLPVLALLMYAGTDWTLLSIALAMEGLLALALDRDSVASFLIGLSASVNPLSLAFTLPLLKRRRRRNVLYLAAGALFFAPLLREEIISWPTEELTGGILTTLIGTPYMLVISLGVSVAVSAYFVRKGYDKVSIPIATSIFMVLAGARPSWLLIPLLSLVPVVGPVELSLVEILSIIPAISWTMPGIISGVLFKCTASATNDPCSDPFIFTILALIITVCVAIRRIYGKSGLDALKSSTQP